MLNTGLTMTFVVDRDGAGRDLARGAANHAGRPGPARQTAHRPPRPRLFARSQPTCSSSAASRRNLRCLGGRAGRLHRRARPRLYRRAVRRARIGRPGVRPDRDSQIAGEMAKISLWELVNLAGAVLGFGRI